MKTDNAFDPNFMPDLPTNTIPMDLETYEQTTNAHMEKFEKLIDGVESIDPKVKSLWKQIYENAVVDRKNAYIVWIDLFVMVSGKNDQHAVHGLTLAKYLERMEKSNGQLIRLAELIISKLDEEDSKKLPQATDFFNKFERSKGQI
jgi:hypothetical protein